jgi:predicted dithiol-disulfide oxidoreductase (DUF899 family)
MTTEEIDKQLETLGAEQMELNKKITELRRARPAEPVAEYALHRSTGEPATLSELFGEKQDLLVVHNMGRECPYCTLWADGFNGVASHLADRSAFVVISPDSPENQLKFAESRGWTFKMASAEGTTFIKDMGFEPQPGEHWPGVSAFKKLDDGSIVRVSHDYLGPGDTYCSVWHLFELLADGPGDWEPKYRY